MQSQQLSVEVRLNSVCIAMGEVLCTEIDLQTFESALDASPLVVVDSVFGKALWVVPVDLREVIAFDSNVATLSFPEAGLPHGAVAAYRLAVLTIGGSPNVSVVG